LDGGDLVLLTQQTLSGQNGVWVVADPPRRPPGYVNAPGREFFAARGTRHRGTLFLCVTSTGVNVAIQAVTARPALRDRWEEQAYGNELALRAGTLGPAVAAQTSAALTDADQANAAYIGYTLGLGPKATVSAVVGTPQALTQLRASAEFPAGSRVLLNAQSDARDNGIWVVAAASAAVRADDMRAGSRAAGVLVYSAAQRSLWVSTCASEVSVVGRDPLRWVPVFDQAVINSLDGIQVDTARRLVGTTAADVVANTAMLRGVLGVGSRAAVRAVYDSSAATPDQLQAGAVLPSGVTLAVGDRLLLTGQADATRNGVYEVRAGTGAVRPADMSADPPTRAAGSCVWTTDTGRCFVCMNDPGEDVVGQHALHWRELLHPGRLSELVEHPRP
jgi:hypothetical protein